MAQVMLPYGRQQIDDDDIAAVTEALRGDFLTTGPLVEKFESALCNLTGAKYAVACSNGTTALHLSALAIGLKQGEAAIVPSLTFLATANAPHHTGAEIVFADVNPETGLMEDSHLLEALKRCGTLKPKAVFPVHLAGQCVNIHALKEIADNHGLTVICDSCHALGGSYAGKQVGSCNIEDMDVFSFHPVKTITTGEGGAITTNDADFAARMKRLRSHGMMQKPEQGPWVYEMPEPGHNYRITDIQCALGISQLKKLETFVKRRQELVDLYDGLISGLSPAIRPPQKTGGCEASWHLYAVRMDFKSLGMTRADVMNRLRAKGIGTQVHYIPVHLQPYYRNRYGDLSLPGAAHYYEHTLSLPLFPAMTNNDVEKVVESLSEICGVQS